MICSRIHEHTNTMNIDSICYHMNNISTRANHLLITQLTTIFAIKLIKLYNHEYNGGDTKTDQNQ